MSAGRRIIFVISGSVTVRPPSGASVQAPVHNSERPKIERPPNLANGGISDRSKRGLRSQHVQPMSAWRKGWDSNPRGACTPGGFQDRCLKPLGHPSSSNFQLLSMALERTKRDKGAAKLLTVGPVASGFARQAI